MGCLTTITIHNDALHSFKADPSDFALAIFQGIQEAQDKFVAVDVPFKSYGNYITVEPPRHADELHLYIHTGNNVFNLAPWGKDFQRLAEQNPKLASKMLKQAREVVRASERLLKDKTLISNL